MPDAQALTEIFANEARKYFDDLKQIQTTNIQELHQKQTKNIEELHQKQKEILELQIEKEKLHILELKYKVQQYAKDQQN